MAALLTDCTDGSWPAFGAFQPSSGYSSNVANRASVGVRPASSTTHDGSWPRGPWLVGVPGPWAQKPKYQSDDWMMSHPEKQTASTRYPIHLPNTSESMRYTLPTNRMNAMIVTPAPLNSVPHSMWNPRQVCTSCASIRRSPPSRRWIRSRPSTPWRRSSPPARPTASWPP